MRLLPLCFGLLPVLAVSAWGDPVDEGDALAKKGDCDGAIAAYTQAINLKTNLAMAYGGRGWAKGEKGDYAGEIADSTKAIELLPDFGDAYYNRGWAKAQ